MKKMKKRRELDALVNGKLGRRKKGQHELLRNESESSEVEEFSIPEKSVIRKSNSCRFCATCMTVCGFFLLAAIIAAIGGLVWVHLEMKKEVDQLRSQLGEVQSSPQEGLQQIAIKQGALEAKFTSQTLKLQQMQSNISKLTSEVKGNEATITKISENRPTSTKEQYDMVEKSVAQLGSQLVSLQAEVNKLLPLKDTVSIQEHKIQMIDALVDDIDQLNSSIQIHFHQYSVAMQQIKNTTDSLNLQLGLVSAKSGTSTLPDIDRIVKDAMHNSLAQLESLARNQSLDNAHDVAAIWEDITRIDGSIQSLTEELHQQQVVPGDDADRVLDVQNELRNFKNKTSIQFMDIKEKVSTLTTRVDNFVTPDNSDPHDNPDEQSSHVDVLSSTVKSIDIDETIRDSSNLGTESMPVPLEIYGVYTYEDLREKFVAWDVDGDGAISDIELQHVMRGDEHIPYDSYDVDRNGYLSLDELAAAMGFNIDHQYDENTDTETDDSKRNTQYV